jgi:RimJ/RimL family protein N-acetyltransferase
MMSKKSQSLVDGYGALRVCRALSGDPLWLREAMSDDCMLVFAWANDPETRAVSFSSAPISKGDHMQWFTQKLVSPNDRLYIAMDADDRAVGLVRFTLEGKHAAISINLDKNYRGKGYGTVLIQQGCHRVFGTSKVEEVDAFIKPDNAASVKAFQKAGFQEQGQSEIRGQSALHMTIARATMPV